MPRPVVKTARRNYRFGTGTLDELKLLGQLWRKISGDNWSETQVIETAISETLKRQLNHTK
jgi:hypothetical protein